jgi:hypothetical protein
MAEWLNFRDPKFPVVYMKYPQTSPSGEEVELTHLGDDESYIVRFSSKDVAGVYFEIGRYLNLPVDEAMDAFISEISSQGGGVKIGELEEVQVSGYPAYRISLRWREFARTVVFTDVNGVLYRIIYDSGSMMNTSIMASVRFVESDDGN